VAPQRGQAGASGIGGSPDSGKPPTQIDPIGQERTTNLVDHQVLGADFAFRDFIHVTAFVAWVALGHWPEILLSMPDLEFFDIPVYRLPEEDYYKQQEQYIDYLPCNQGDSKQSAFMRGF
jgi:hypothetical protein